MRRDRSLIGLVEGSLDDVAHEARTVVDGMQGDGGRGNAGRLTQGSLDILDLDAEAAQFDLLVATAEV